MREDLASEAEEVESESDDDDCSEITVPAGAVGIAVGEAVTREALCESDSESLEDDEDDEDRACLRFLLRMRRFPGTGMLGGGIGKG